MDSLKEKHDDLLKNAPDDYEHDSANCALCNENIEKSNTTEGGDMKTYTEDEFTTAVKEAVAPLQAAADAKVAELQSKLDEINSSKADEEVAGQIAQVQADLDSAELRATAAETKYDELITYFNDLSAEAEEAAKTAARKEEVRSLVKEAAGFKDDYINEHIDRWAAMSEEAFTATLEDWKAAKEAKPEETASEELNEVPAETAMSNVRNKETKVSSARTVFAARNAGVDVRKF